jgi:hypothetical protein
MRNAAYGDVLAGRPSSGTDAIRKAPHSPEHQDRTGRIP